MGNAVHTYAAQIGGYELQIRSSRSEADVASLVKTVNRKICEFEKEGVSGSVEAILRACLFFCEENRRLKENAPARKGEIKRV